MPGWLPQAEQPSLPTSLGFQIAPSILGAAVVSKTNSKMLVLARLHTYSLILCLVNEHYSEAKDVLLSCSH